MMEDSPPIRPMSARTNTGPVVSLRRFLPRMISYPTNFPIAMAWQLSRSMRVLDPLGRGGTRSAWAPVITSDARGAHVGARRALARVTRARSLGPRIHIARLTVARRERELAVVLMTGAANRRVNTMRPATRRSQTTA